MGAFEYVALDGSGKEKKGVLEGDTARQVRQQMVSDLEIAIGRFAKRQQTWFRGMERRGVPIRWIGPEDGDAILTSIGTRR